MPQPATSDKPDFSLVKGLDLSGAKAHMEVEQFDTLVKLVNKYHELWQNQEGLGNAQLMLNKHIYHDISVGGSLPIHSKLYQVPPLQHGIVDEHVNKMLEQ